MRRIGLLVLVLASARMVAADPRSAALQTLAFSSGPTVVLAPDSLAGAVNVGVWYAAGSRNDPAGRAGLAYVLARGALSPPPESRAALEALDAGFDLTVTPDLSSTSVTLPAEQLRVAIDYMAGRVTAPAVNAAALRAAIDGAKGERLRRLQQSPLLPGLEQVNATLFAGHGYAAPASGDDLGLDAITAADAARDLSSRFAASRAIITVTGRFDPAEAITLLEARLGSPSRTPAAAPVVLPAFGPIEPRVDGGTLSLPVTVVVAGWRLPPGSDKDAAALEVLGQALAGGAAARLERLLVTPEGPFLQVQGNFERRADACLFVVAAALKGAVDTATVESQLAAGVERWAREPMTAADLEPARRSIEAALLERAQSTAGRAEALALALLVDGSLGAWDSRLASIRSVTPAEVQRAAARSLVEAQRTIVWTEPAPPVEEGQP